MTPDRPVLAVRGLCKSYGSVVALDGVDLEVAPGEICGLLGPNGAGKTTLVSIVAGLRRADRGAVALNGIDVLARPREARRHLGLAPQETGIYPTLRVRDNLVFFGELADLRGRLLAQRIDEVADSLSLSEFLDRPARELSGGEKRRLHTAVALLHRPPLLLLDEPTTGVDVRTRADVLALVRRLAEEGSTVCYSTHYLAEVEALGASVAIIDRGQVIARGSVADLVHQHGGAAVELRFDGPPPVVAIDRRQDRFASTLRVYSDQPAVDAAAVLNRLDGATARLREIEIVSPSLESVFLSITGRRYAPDDQAVQEIDHVAAT